MATLVTSSLSFLGSIYVLIMSLVRCRIRQKKQRRLQQKQTWSLYCATHATAIIVLNVTCCSGLIALVLMIQVGWTLLSTSAITNSTQDVWQFRHQGACDFFGFVLQMLQWATMLWNVCISIVYTNFGQRSKRWLFVVSSAATV